MRKTLLIKLTLLLIIPGWLFTASCAKKTTVQSESAKQAEQKEAEMLAAKRAKEEALARQKEEARKRTMEEERLRQKRMEEEAAKRAARAVQAAKEKFLNEDIYFEFDKSSLIEDAQEILKRKARWMRDNPGVSVIIEGHCDERGTNEYNLALGDRRAESAKTFLLDLGISGSRLTTISYGEERPQATGNDEEAWSKNRRAHFVIR